MAPLLFFCVNKVKNVFRYIVQHWLCGSASLHPYCSLRSQHRIARNVGQNDARFARSKSSLRSDFAFCPTGGAFRSSCPCAARLPRCGGASARVTSANCRVCEIRPRPRLRRGRCRTVAYAPPVKRNKNSSFPPLI